MLRFLLRGLATRSYLSYPLIRKSSYAMQVSFVQLSKAGKNMEIERVKFEKIL